MEPQQIGEEIWARITPSAPPSGTWPVLIALGVAAGLVVVPALWRLTRPAVTIVHELGHAAVGILAGRRFTGFVVSADMSGHAVTVGKRRGIGRILTTWAGYPAPAVLGAALIQIALAGWAGTALFAALLVLLGSLVFTRSLHTVAAVLGSAAAVGLIWWFGGAAAGGLVTLAIGAFLLLGAWSHLAAVITSGRRGDDPAQLAQLTPLPAWCWNGTFVLVLGACTWWAIRALMSGN